MASGLAVVSIVAVKAVAARAVVRAVVVKAVVVTVVETVAVKGLAVRVAVVRVVVTGKFRVRKQRRCTRPPSLMHAQRPQACFWRALLATGDPTGEELLAACKA